MHTMVPSGMEERGRVLPTVSWAEVATQTLTKARIFINEWTVAEAVYFIEKKKEK